jgi:hypothetical protein
LFESVAGLTHAPPHAICPGGHMIERQTFITQLWSAAQTLPHVPQLRGSLPTSTHEPEQFVWPGGHMSTHRPFEQTALAAH